MESGVTGQSGENRAKLGLGSSDRGNVKDSDPGTDMATTEGANQILILTSTSILTYGSIRGIEETNQDIRKSLVVPSNTGDQTPSQTSAFALDNFHPTSFNHPE